MQKEIPLSMPDINEEDMKAVRSVLESLRLSLGPKLPGFERDFTAYVGTKHAVAVSSGTTALHLAMRALDLKDDDEVITSPFSFIASSNCILFERAKPVFVDILQETFCIDSVKVETAITQKTKAILAVDVFGYLAEWDALKRIAEKYHLLLIEDSCEALGTARGKKKAGTFGECGVFGFYPNKQMTTGEGGMLVTDRDDIADAARSMRNQGRNAHGGFLHHEQLGYNYRLSDINCALGISQLKRLPRFIAQRAQVVAWYGEELGDIADMIHTPSKQQGVDVSWFVYIIRLADRFSVDDRDRLIDHLKNNGIACNTYFPSIHLQPFYQRTFGGKSGDFPVAETASARNLALPFFANLTREQVAHVCKVLKNGLRSLS